MLNKFYKRSIWGIYIWNYIHYRFIIYIRLRVCKNRHICCRSCRM